MGLMIPDWYDMLMHTLPGKITLAVVLATVLATSVWVSRAHVPAEGVGTAMSLLFTPVVRGAVGRRPLPRGRAAPVPAVGAHARRHPLPAREAIV